MNSSIIPTHYPSHLDPEGVKAPRGIAANKELCKSQRMKNTKGQKQRGKCAVCKQSISSTKSVLHHKNYLHECQNDNIGDCENCPDKFFLYCGRQVCLVHFNCHTQIHKEQNKRHNPRQYGEKM